MSPPRLLLLLALLLPLSAAMVNNFSAASCCARGPRCSASAARRSGPCRTRLWMSQQSLACRKLACAYCRQPNRRKTVPVCRMDAISKNCFGGHRPPAVKRPARSRPGRKKRGHRKPKRVALNPQKSRPNPPPSNNGGPGCGAIRGAGGKVVIDSSRLPLNGAWERTANSIVWKSGGGPGIDPMGSGTVCAKVIFPTDGKYYMTALTQAPHGTEHNDCWVKFSAGLDLYRPQGGKFRSGNADWYKAYQNDGGMRMANYWLTIDHDGHQLITKYVVAGRPYLVCVSGRSTKYHIHKIIFVKCAGGEACSRFRGDIRRQMAFLPSSKCY